MASDTEALKTLRARVASLETENATLRAQVPAGPPPNVLEATKALHAEIEPLVANLKRLLDRAIDLVHDARRK